MGYDDVHGQLVKWKDVYWPRKCVKDDHEEVKDYPGTFERAFQRFRTMCACTLLVRLLTQPRSFYCDQKLATCVGGGGPNYKNDSKPEELLNRVP